MMRFGVLLLYLLFFCFGHDAEGIICAERNLISRTDFNGRTTTFEYDRYRNRLSIQSDNGTSVVYRYDALNRIVEVDDANLGVTAYSYDPAGNLSTLTAPTAIPVTVSYSYDQRNRVTGVTSTRGTQTIAQFQYTHTPTGHRNGSNEYITGDGSISAISRTISYTYDQRYRLLEEETSGSVTGNVSYQLDAVGNRTQRQSSIPGVGVQTFAFDARDRIVSNSYDENGNTLQSPLIAAGLPSGTVVDTYTYNNRIKTRTLPDGRNITLVYDGDGNRVRKILDGGATVIDYLIDDASSTGYAQVVEELTNGVVSRVYTYGHDLISQDVLRDEVNGIWDAAFFGYDGGSHTRYLLDVSGDTVATFTYDAYGVLIGQQGTIHTNYLYRGEQYDHDMGLYYLRARYYDAQSGRFSTMDEWEGEAIVPSSLHKYLYAHADPVNSWDPSGYMTIASNSAATSVQANLSRTVISNSSRQAYRKVTKTLTCQVGVASFGAAIKGLPGHHPINKSFKGDSKQILIWIPWETHNMYHQVLNLLLRTEPELKGMGNWTSKEKWKDTLEDNAVARKLLIRNMRVAARFVDKKCKLRAPNSLTHALNVALKKY